MNDDEPASPDRKGKYTSKYADDEDDEFEEVDVAPKLLIVNKPEQRAPMEDEFSSVALSEARNRVDIEEEDADSESDVSSSKGPIDSQASEYDRDD